MRQHSSQHRMVLLFVLVLQAVFALAASVKTSYTLAYAPVGPSSSKPTPFAVIVSSPREPDSTEPTKQQKSTSKKQGSKSAAAAQQQPLSQPKQRSGPLYTIESYTPPGKKESALRAQIGILASSGKAFNGSSTVASVASLKDPLQATLYVQLSASDIAESVSLREFRKEAKKPGAKGADGPALELVKAAPEPRPLLNRPVVLNAEGKVDEEVKEKSFMQRYWWVGVALLVFTLLTGGDK